MDITEALEKLEDSGHRLTGPRRRLLEAIFARSEGFTAEDLVAEERSIGRATVYRTLQLLVEQGLVCKLVLQDGKPRYILSRVSHHHHLVCVGCGAVREFRRPTIERLLADLDAEVGAVVGHRLEVYVYCEGCQADAHRTPAHS